MSSQSTEESKEDETAVIAAAASQEKSNEQTTKELKEFPNKKKQGLLEIAPESPRRRAANRRQMNQRNVQTSKKQELVVMGKLQQQYLETPW